MVGAEKEGAEDEGADGGQGFGPAVFGAAGRLARYAEADEDCVAWGFESVHVSWR